MSDEERNLHIIKYSGKKVTGKVGLISFWLVETSEATRNS